MKIRLLTLLLFAGNTLSAQITFIPDSIFEQKLIDLNHDIIHDGWVITDSINSIDSLDISSFNGQADKITDLTGIEGFGNLQYLNCSNNKFDTLNLNNNQYLKHIICASDSIEVLKIDSLFSLSVLECNSNNITELNLLGNPSLTELGCWDNQIINLNLSSNIYLGYLFCGENNLTSLDVSMLDLYDLSCQNNAISTINLDNNYSLEWLTCYNNNLQDINLTVNTNLIVLNVGNVSTQPSIYSNDLNTLDLSYNCNITTFYSKGNPNLECIQVCDISAANNWNALNIDAQHFFSTGCIYTAITEGSERNQKIISIKDIYGRESSTHTNSFLFYIYQDGRVEKRIILDN
jgi:hypothetical protein